MNSNKMLKSNKEQNDNEKILELLETEKKELVPIVINDLKVISEMDNTQKLNFKKQQKFEKFNIQNSLNYIQDIKDNSMNHEDIADCLNEDDNEVEIVHCDTKYFKNLWLCMRNHVSSHAFSQNPGRNIKFIVKINGKYAGFFSIASEIISIGSRDKFIGWNEEYRNIKDDYLNYSANASTLVPMQPFGYICGGKLISLLLYHKKVRDIWMETYESPLVSITTTSLNGKQKSQYNGMKKYWKSLGETTGGFPEYPSDKVYDRIREWVNQAIKYDPEVKEYHAKKFKSQTNSKAKIIEIFYKFADIKSHLEANRLEKDDLTIKEPRGVYFARLYDNSKEFLQGKISESDLVERDLNFDVTSANSIFEYWRKKFAYNRFDNKIEEPLFLDRNFQNQLQLAS